MAAFSALQNALTSEPIMAFPRADRQYALITDAATGTADTPGGLGAILTQKDQYDNYYAISYAFRQLKDHKKITHHFFWNQPRQYGAWMSSMNTSRVNNSSFLRITSH
jgi:RNase H-like domain found in reverse transcriptase